MKKGLLLTILLAAAALSDAWAADLVSYTATAPPGSNPDANGSVDVWTEFDSGGGFKGTFLGDSSQNGGAGGGTSGSSGAGAGTSAWGLYAGGATDASVTIQHFFDGGPLAVGQTISIDLDNGYVGNPSDSGTSEVGLRLFGTGFNFILAFNYIEGQGHYTYFDTATNFGNSGLNYTDNGFNFSYTQTSADSYLVDLSQGNTVVATWSGVTPTGVAPAIIELYDLNGQGAGPTNNGGSSDFFANNLEVVPEPSTYVIAALAAVSIVATRRPRRK